MTILGIEIKHPSPVELALAALLIAVVAGTGAALVWGGLLDARGVWPLVAASSAGVLLAAFGISVARHGWRAVVLLVICATLLYVVIPV